MRKKVNLYAKQKERFWENGNFAGNSWKYLTKNKRQNEKKTRHNICVSPLFLYKKNWQLPIFAYTIFGVNELDFCVRYGNRYTLIAIVTNLLFGKSFPENMIMCIQSH